MTDPSKMITKGQSSYETCPECGVRIVEDPAKQNHFPHPSATANPIAILRRQVAEEIAAAIREIPIGKGSEHWKHGRETMQADAIKALGEIVEIVWKP